MWMMMIVGMLLMMTTTMTMMDDDNDGHDYDDEKYDEVFGIFSRIMNTEY
jgi:hypothetical protein